MAKSKIGKKIMSCALRTYSKTPVGIKRIVMKAIHFSYRFKKFEFEVHLCEHCNLKCRGCDNYSSIAEEEYVDIESLCSDFKRMSELFGDDISSIHLLGGEPLLNPKITEILIRAREIFPNVELMIISNGILIPKQGEEFLKVCRDNRITIMLTRYPISLDYDGIISKLRDAGIEAGTFSNEAIKTLYRKPLDMSGNQNQNKMFDLCLNADRCVTLKKGRLYTCTTIPNVCHFNKAFGKNIPVSAEDSIDIYDAGSSKEIRKFLSKSVPFCKYCKISEEQFGLEWGVTKKDISEWADEK